MKQAEEILGALGWRLSSNELLSVRLCSSAVTTEDDPEHFPDKVNSLEVQQPNEYHGVIWCNYSRVCVLTQKTDEILTKCKSTLEEGESKEIASTKRAGVAFNPTSANILKRGGLEKYVANFEADMQEMHESYK